MELIEYKRMDWFVYLDHSMKDLAAQAIVLYEREKQLGQEVFHDYSFVVFPMAKAYEGFLKKYFYDMDLLSQRDFESSYFRVGKSLNPDLPKRYREEDWVYERLKLQLTQKGRGELASQTWTTWKEGRNVLFHYFAKHQNFISLKEAGERLKQMSEMIQELVEVNKQELGLND